MMTGKAPAASPGIYAREPLRFHDGIPVFSHPDAYTENYERIADDHLTSMRQTGNNPFIQEHLWREMEQSTADLARTYAPDGGRVLDVGVGLGRTLSLLPPSLKRHGMDISLGYLAEARAQGIEVCYSRVEDTPYLPGLFDVVICADVLEHVLDLNLACSRILSVLKDGGVLVARVPYRENLAAYLDPGYPYRFAHLRNFDEHSLRLLFEKIFGCAVLEVAKTCWVPPEDFYAAHKMKWPVSFPQRDRLIRWAFTALGKASPSAYQRWTRRLYDPIEINVAVRKNSAGASPARET